MAIQAVLSKQEKIKILFTSSVGILFLLGFLILFGYGITRPVIDSLFIHEYTSKALPFVWPWTTLAATIILVIYNQFNTRYSIISVFRVSLVISLIILLVLLTCYHYEIPYSMYFLAIWKDTYIVVFVEIFWTYADLRYTLHKAKNLYGIFLAAGSIGGLAGAFMIHPLITHFGHSTALLVAGASFVLLFFITYLLKPIDALEKKNDNTKTPIDWKAGLGVVKASKYLQPILMMVLLTQVSITFLEYEYSSFLEQSIPDLNERTKLMGLIQASIDVFSITMQLSTAFLIHKIGLTRIIIGIPIFTVIAVCGFLISPQLLTLCIFRITSKSIDYSLFKATKEMLYVPLNPFEKTQGKAIIDIFIYRCAKGLSSVLIIFVTIIRPLHFVLILLVSWSYCARIIAKRYSKLTDENADVNTDLSESVS